MTRADLHSAFVIDREIYDASQVDPSLLDPIVRPVAGLPGPVNPVAVVRAYQGPHGGYTEQFVLTDADGAVRYRSELRRIQLSGEMFEDRFVTTIRALALGDHREHAVTFYVNDEEVGSVPVFIEAGRGGDPKVAAQETFKKAVSKGDILWLSVPQPAPAQRSWLERKKPVGAEHAQAVWFVYEDDKVYVLNGPGEQQVPNLPNVERVTIIARSKDHRSEVSKIPATVRTVDPSEDVWERVMKTAVTNRLNLPDMDQAIERWRATCVLLELTPVFHESRRAAADAQSPEAAAGAAPAEPAAASPAPEEDKIEVDVQIDQETFDKLIAEGKPERIARAKAKAAYVRRERARVKAEQEAS